MRHTETRRSCLAHLLAMASVLACSLACLSLKCLAGLSGEVSGAEPLVLQQGDYNNDVHSLAFSPDGRLLAVGCEGNHPLKLFDTRTRHLLWSDTREAGSYLSGVAFSPDGLSVAGVGFFVGDNVIAVWDVRSGRLQRVLKRNWAQCVAWSPDGRWLCVGGATPRVGYSRGPWAALWDTRSWKLLWEWAPVAEERVGRVAWAPDGARLAVGCLISGGDIRVKTGTRIWLVPRDASAVRKGWLQLEQFLPGGAGALAWSPDGSLLATGGQNTRLSVWKVPPLLISAPLMAQSGRGVPSAPSGEPKKPKPWTVSRPLDRPRGRWNCIAFAPRGLSLAGVCSGFPVQLWFPRTWSLQRTLEPRSGGAEWRALAFTPDGASFATGGEDGTVALWPQG